MNKELLKLVRAAGAPEEVIYELWFNIFCQKFAVAIIDMSQEEINKAYKEGRIK